MKINGLQKSFTLTAAALASLAAIALFVTLRTNPVGPMLNNSPGGMELAGDTIPKEQREAFQKSMASGDAYFNKKDYLNAKSAYQVAVSQNPSDAAAKEKLRKTMELLRSQKAQNILFDVAVANADKLFQAGEYDKAMAEYENAAKVLPSDPYPKNRINEIIKIKVDTKVKGEEYAAAIARADKFYGVKNYADALVDYKKALAIKADEKYPQDRVTELTRLIAEQKKKDEAYIKAIMLADQAFKDVKYPDAVKSYKDALAIKPEQAYPKDKIREIEEIIARNARNQADYDKYIAQGDSLYIDKKYFKARESYLMASSVKPKEAYPKEMIAKSDKLLTGQEAAMAKALEEQYAQTIAGADKLLADKSLEAARAEYMKASNLKPAEQYPKDKIREIENTFANAVKDKEERYKMAIAAGDRAFGNKLYESARVEYLSALEIKPAEAYPKNKVAEVDKLIAALAQQKAADSRFANTIGKADSLFMAKAYLPSKAEFEKASKMKPEEVYPKNRIVEINLILYNLDKQKAQEGLYAAAIAKADKLMAEKAYGPAKAEYAGASAMKPDETYPKEKLAEIAKFDEAYLAAIASGDIALAEKKYDQAKSSYTTASGIRPSEKYPMSKIAEIDLALAGLAKQRSLDENYTAIIANADKLLGEKSYEQSKVQYQAALKLKPGEQYPKDQIAGIDKSLADLAALKALDETYKAAIAKGDQLLAAKSYDAARTEFVKAADLQPSVSYPKEKITEIDAALAAVAKQKALDAEYAAAVANADKLLAAKSYDPARAEYVRAADLQPSAAYPKEKIAEIDKTLADLAALKSREENYNTAIAKGDQLLAEKSYDAARVQFVTAADLQPQAAYPKEKITAIDAALAAIAKQKALDEEYAAAIASGDKLLGEKSWDAARAQFVKAAALQPSTAYPKEKIAEIDKALADLAALKSLEENYNAAIAKGDQLLAEKAYDAARISFLRASDLQPKSAYPKEKITEIDAALAAIAKQKALDAEYAAAVANADKLLAAKSYDPARAEYVRAADLQPQSAYPKEKIAEIDKTLADLAALKTLEENYNAAIVKGDNLLAAKTYDAARAEFVRAADLKPQAAYPKEKIAVIDAALAAIAKQKALDEEYAAALASGDKLLGEKSWDAARIQYVKAADIQPSAAYPKEKIAEIDKALADLAAQKTLEENYKAAVAKGDQLLAEKTYDAARLSFVKAADLQPSAAYPKEKITEIDAALAAIAKQKALDAEYAAAVASADKLLAAKSYDPARAAFVKAADLQPSAAYPKEKIAEIDKILADLAAQKLLAENYKAAIEKGDQLLAAKSYDAARAEFVRAADLQPSVSYPKEKIAVIDAALAAIAKQKALDEEYAAAIATGDKLLGEKSWDAARISFVRASDLKPAASYPKEKITEIDKALNDLARLKAIDEQYATAIAGADKLLQDKTYDQAKTAYLDAGKIKPSEQYPKDKVKEIDDALAAIAKQKSLDDQYKAAVAKGDQALAANNYEQAKTEFTGALTLKPEEAYPKEKIAAIDGILAEMKAKEDAYKASIAAADLLLTQKKYEEARKGYEEALVIKPSAIYPKEKIAEINKALEELLGKQKYYDNLIAEADNTLKEKDYTKAKETYQQALGLFPAETYPKNQISMITARVDSLYRANKSFYDKAIADGDRAYNNFEFDKAIDAYTEAANFLPMEKYPREMVVKIRRTIAENAIVDVLKTTVIITSNNEKEFSFTPVNIASRKNNFVYIKIKNLSGKPFNVLMRYGKDKQANGGVVMRNLNPDGKVAERLVSVKDQDLWSREDNNWISLYPQGGDVEVSFIQVSRSK